jgi:hypothetical protein
MTDSWKPQVDEYLRLAYEIAQSSLATKYKKSILDRCLRGASDIISCENLQIHNNTMSMIQWCRRWSVEALADYEIVQENLTINRGGKPPTHRQVCEARDAYGKRYWTVEHQYPVLIPKNGLMFNNWGLAQLKDWMYTYGYATIITPGEDQDLLTTTDSTEEASKRYKIAGIEVVIHPYHRSH